MVVFTARDYAAADAAEIFLNVYLAEDVGDEHLYCTLQRPKPEMDEPDELYFEVNDQGFNCVDGVAAVELHLDRLTVRLSLRGQRVSHLGETIEVGLALPAGDLVALRRDLVAVLTGLCPFTDHTV